MAFANLKLEISREILASLATLCVTRMAPSLHPKFVHSFIIHHIVYIECYDISLGSYNSAPMKQYGRIISTQYFFSFRITHCPFQISEYLQIYL